MMLGNPWGLLGLAAVPVILFIHLFRRRFPPREIAGLFLWSAPRLETRSGERRQKLPVSLSLILEILAALLLALLLCDPRMTSREKLRHTVFVLDNSASMAATDDAGRSAADRARDVIARALPASARYARGTLVVTGERPQILGRTESMPADVAESLAAYRPGLPGHSPLGALNLAVEIAGDAGEVVFLTDRLPDEQERPISAACIARGAPAANVGIVGAEWLRAGPGDKSEIFLRVANYATTPARTTVTGRAAGKTFARKTLALAPGAVEKLVLPAPPADAVSFSLPPDALAPDNMVTLVAPPRRIVKVANLLTEEVARARLSLALDAAEDVEDAGSARPDLAVAPPDLFAPGDQETWWLVIGPLREPYRGAGEPRNYVGPFLIERAHPLVEGVSLQGIVWPGAAPPAAALTPIVSVGSVPLIAFAQPGRVRAYWLNLDLAHSNLTRAPDWPILISNMAELRRAALPGLPRRSFRAGEAIVFRNPVPGSALVLVGPRNYRKELPRLTEISLPRLTDPGVYRITADEKTVELLTVNLLDDVESDLRDLARGEIAGQTPPRAARIAAGERPRWLVFAATIAAFAALIANWWLNSRSIDGH